LKAFRLGELFCGTGDWGTGNGGAVRKRRGKPEREAWKEGMRDEVRKRRREVTRFACLLLPQFLVPSPCSPAKNTDGRRAGSTPARCYSPLKTGGEAFR
jgi:hypothetical protein